MKIKDIEQILEHRPYAVFLVASSRLQHHGFPAVITKFDRTAGRLPIIRTRSIKPDGLGQSFRAFLADIREVTDQDYPHTETF